MIKNLGSTLETLKPFLRKYLLVKGTQFKGRLFSCPNKQAHKNLDIKPGCNFLDKEETKFYCYVCLPGHEEVRTSLGLKPIKDLLIGEKVYTRLGQETTLINKVKHDPQYAIINLQTGLTPIGHSMTQNHAIPIIKQEQVYTMPYIELIPNRYKFSSRAFYRNHISKYTDVLNIFKVPAKDIRVGDYLLYPETRHITDYSKIYTDRIIKKYTKGPMNKRITKIPLEDDILWMFGLYIAEGNTYRGGVRFTLHKNETAYQIKLKQIFKTYFAKDLVERVHNNSWTATCSSTDLELIFRELFNDLAENKIYPYFFNYLPIDKRHALFSGIMAGDGSKTREFIKITSSALIAQLFDLGISLHKIPSYQEYPEYTDNMGIRHLKTYSLSFIRPSLRGFFETIEGVTYLLQQVTKISLCGQEPVYDITVKDQDHSFVGKFFTFYNCGASGDIVDAVHLLEARPITGSGFHDTIEYLCKLVKVPFELAEETPESKFMQEVEAFLGALVSKAHTNLKNLVVTQPEHPAVKLLQTKGWLNSVDTYKLGLIQAVKENKSQKLMDVCNFLNLDLNHLVNGIIIPIEFKHKLIGFQIRATDLNTLGGMKYKTYLSTSKGLFNLDNIDASQPVYIVEGASSVIVMHNFGIDNVVSTLGNGLNESHYEALISKDVKDVCVLYDNDEGGELGRKRGCETFVGKGEIKLNFKLLSKENDPADYVLAGNKLETLPTLTLWDYLLHKGYKELMLKYVAAQQDLIDKEKLVNILAKELDVPKSILLEEIHKYESTISEVPTIMSLKEKESIIETINTFEKWAWSRGELLGIKSFDCFDKCFDGLQEGLILVGGAPNVGKCLSGETLIQTTLGLVPIQNLFKEKNKVIGTFTNPTDKFSVPGPLSLEPVTKLYYTKSKCYKVILNNGREIIGTPEHPLLTNIGVFKQLKELTLKDQLITSNGANIWGTKVTLNKFVPSQQLLATATIIPKMYPIELTKDLAFLLGLYIGDGACFAPDFSITQKTPYNTTINKLIKKLFGIRPHTYKLELSAGRLIRTYFEEILGVPYVTGGYKEVPSCIWTAPKEVVAAFISGYFAADGYINKTRVEISLTTKSYKMSQQLATLLDNFGVRNYIRVVNRCASNTKLKIKRNYYTVTVRGTYEDAVRFRSEVCSNRTGRSGKFHALEKLTGQFNRSYQPLRTNTGIRFEPMGIKEIIYLTKEQEVYDISVPTTHQFIANGIVSHNSALTTSIACRIMETTPNPYIIYLSIDDSAIITTARFLANLSGIPINIVSNPKHRIVENKYYTDAERKDLMVRREKALEYMRKHVTVFNLKDASSGYTIEYLNTLFKSLEPIIKDKKVVLIVDNLHKLRSLRDFKSDKSLVDSVCSNLKILSGVYKCPVIATVEHTKASIQLGEVGGSAIKESSSLHYDANLILTVVLKQVVGTFKLVDVIVSKNKMSTFIGALPFRLYPDQSRMEACDGNASNFGLPQDGPVSQEVKTEPITQGEPDGKISSNGEGNPINKEQGTPGVGTEEPK
jgi:intein/homing endonuclease/5S rRNA maturation endonuclease (ribonuclease M5)